MVARIWTVSTLSLCVPQQQHNLRRGEFPSPSFFTASQLFGGLLRQRRGGREEGGGGQRRVGICPHRPKAEAMRAHSLHTISSLHCNLCAMGTSNRRPGLERSQVGHAHFSDLPFFFSDFLIILFLDFKFFFQFVYQFTVLCASATNNCPQVHNRKADTIAPSVLQPQHKEQSFVPSREDKITAPGEIVVVDLAFGALFLGLGWARPHGRGGQPGALCRLRALAGDGRGGGVRAAAEGRQRARAPADHVQALRRAGRAAPQPPPAGEFALLVG